MIEFKNQELHVIGKITFDNAENYYLNGLKVIQNEQAFPLTVNLSKLEQGSTLTLAVLVQWLRQTPDAQGLQFKAVPEKMMKIIQSCHLENDLQLI
ncbi:STAS domain-containing protein [Acinetobacter silvestris]|uniref:Toluene tolerance protein n=1 Tax=Acinetobacter silvestris TaxID=1977882 RepID=A0A1Y3CK54_9GAMM|nr:STAS domain-containing protein [Acinetobacter silvestris]OTG67490.1 toluene tolerance protein [Acinetobacter silvestris]